MCMTTTQKRTNGDIIGPRKQREIMFDKKNYISEDNLKELIGEALPVFLRWFKHQTAVIHDGKIWYPMSDYERWLDGENPAD